MGLGDRIQHWNEDTRRVNYAARTNGWVGGSGRCEKQNFAFQEKKGQMDDSIREIKIQIALFPSWAISRKEIKKFQHSRKRNYKISALA